VRSPLHRALKVASLAQPLAVERLAGALADDVVVGVVVQYPHPVLDSERSDEEIGRLDPLAARNARRHPLLHAQSNACGLLVGPAPVESVLKLVAMRWKSAGLIPLCRSSTAKTG
jgi:hypothetical protein